MTHDPRELMARALHELQRAQQRIDELEGRDHAPLPIVGLACRLPRRVASAAELWAFLCAGGHVADEIPAERWDVDRFHDPEPGKPGRIAPRRAALLADIRGFDAAFFGIAPREAELMDPQQRLLLEVAWHAFEDAGLPPVSVAGAPIGVFLGISTVDYGYHLVQNLPPEQVTGHAGTGTNHAVAAGRIAYLLDLRGPCLALDTACSSSLVALHLAAQSLRRGECQAALVLGVNAILSPLTSASFSHARMLAADGVCKTFDARADGYGRGEGAVAVVLTTRAFAQTRGLRARAELLGSAVNQDGRSAGLTVPNGPAQEAVLRAALAAARCGPGDIDFVEAHGTGTALGDPIELGALANVFAAAHAPDRPLYVSAVKTNLGHTEAAAGLLGVAKTVLQIQHAELVPHLHLQQPNPHVPWARLPIAIPTQRTPWPTATRRAGVSSFGFSGTNAHVILGDAAAPAPVPAPPPVFALALAAATPNALTQLAAAWRERLQTAPPHELADLLWTAANGRSPLRCRGVVLGRTNADLMAGCAAIAPGQVVGAHPDAMVMATARAFVGGEPLVAAALLGRTAGRVAEGPLYPFEHVPAWIARQHGSDGCELLFEDWPATSGPTQHATMPGLHTTGAPLPPRWQQALQDAHTADGAGVPAAWLHFLDLRSQDPGPIAATTDLLAVAARAVHRDVRRFVVVIATPMPDGPTVGALRAALRALSIEQPQSAVHAIVVDDPDAEALARQVAIGTGECRIMGPTIRRPRWHRLSVAPPARPALATDGTFLLTGGTGALGELLAHWLLRQGARQLVLAARHPRPLASGLLQQADANGATVTTVALDVTDAAAVATQVAALATATPPLRAVFHLAGTLDDAPVTSLTAERVAAAMAAKVLGAQHLHAATAQLPLHTFVCASSAVAWFGNPGQTAYAAANGALLGLCRQRRAAGLPALALAFGPLAAGGMAADPALQQRLARLGIQPLRHAEIVAGLQQALHLPCADAALVRIDWARFAPRLPAPLRACLAEPHAAVSPPGTTAAWRTLPPAAAEAHLATAIAAAAAAVLGQAASAIASDTPLPSLGLDSLLATDLRQRIRDEHGLDAPFALLLGAADCRAIARQLLASPPMPPPDADDDALQDWIGRLSDAEVQAMLRQTPPGGPEHR